MPSQEVSEDFGQVWHDRTAPDAADLRRAAGERKRHRVLELRRQGLTYSAIAREVELHRVTVKQWLVHPPEGQAPPEMSANDTGPIDSVPHDQTPLSDDKTQPSTNPSTLSGGSNPPPAPEQDWDQVRQMREALREHRFLLMRRPEHLNADQQAVVADLLASPLAELTTARTFLLDWYALWKDEQGCRRSVAEARTRYEAWRSNPVYLAVPALQRLWRA